MFDILILLWYLVGIVQSFFNYGTAYRLTRRGGDNGVSLYGWLLAFGFASCIPGLGYYFWRKSNGEYFENYF